MIMQHSFSADISEFIPWPEALELVPALSSSEYDALRTSIGHEGIHVPLSVVKPGAKFVVLDGCSRLKAASELGISQIPAVFVQVTPDAYAAYVLVQAANRKYLQAGQRAALAVLLTRELLQLRKHQPGWKAFTKWLPASVTVRGIKTHQIAAHIFEVSVGYLSLARKICRQKPEMFDLLLSGSISIAEAGKSLAEIDDCSSESGTSDDISVHELKTSLKEARERIRELEEARDHIRKHLEVILPFAKRVLKGESMQARYRFVLRPVPRNTLAEAVQNAEELKEQLCNLKKQVAELEAENLLLAVRHDDPQQMMLVHSLCLLKSAFDVSTVQDSLDALKTLPVITRDAVDEFFRLLTRVINFSNEFISELQRISVSTPSHLNETAQDELKKYVKGHAPETAFNLPALRNTARQQLVIYTREAMRDRHNYPVKPGTQEGMQHHD